MNFYTHPVQEMDKKWRGPTQTLLVMKLIILLTVLFCIRSSASVNAQNINLSVKNAPIETVFTEIKKQSGYGFFYDKSDIKNFGKVNLSLKNATLKEALDQCFNGRALSYEIVDNTIVVKKKGTQQEETTTLNNKSIPITGKVTDETGQIMPGATITNKNTSKSVVANDQGIYSIEANETDILVFSFLGYKPQEVKVGKQREINISLKAVEGSLDAIQYIAYGSTTKRQSTGNISSVKAEVIASQPVTNPLEALAGRVAGLQITQSGSLPGAPIKVEIRGQNSIASSNKPLYVIDGVPFSSTSFERFASVNNAPIGNGSSAEFGSPLNSISPNDIESIEVLKDADATSIYGSRAANGVILITTKRGSGKAKVDVNVRSGIGEVTRMPAMATTAQYIQLRKDAFANSNVVPTAANAPELLTWDQNANFDWQNWMIGNTAKNTDASASFSGGNEQLSFLVSGNYHHEGSILAGNNKYERGGVHSNINYRSTDGKLVLNSSIFFNRDKNLGYGATPASPAYIAVIRSAPNFQIYDSTGNFNWPSGKTNYMAQQLANNSSQNSVLNGSLNLSYTVLPGLMIKGNLGYNQSENNIKNLIPISSLNPTAVAGGGTSSFANTQSSTLLFEPQLAYSHGISKGKLDVLAGSTIQSNDLKSQFLRLTGYTNDLLLSSTNFGTVNFKSSTTTKYNYLSLFGRLTYNWDGKYIVNGTIRRDGSTKFGPGKQFGTFGSIGGAWLFNKEEFIKNSLPWLSYGKLRSSWGTSGNDGIGDYGYLNLYTNTTDYGSTVAITSSQLANADFQWEVNKKLEVALELGFFKDKLLFNTVWYRNRSGNQLVGYSLPSITGFASYTANLPALVENKGWEFDLTSSNLEHNGFKWQTGFNLTVPKNKLLSFPGLNTSSYANTYIEGQPLSVVQGLHYNGVDPATGLPIFQDTDGNGLISTNSFYNGQGGDNIIIGRTNPKLFAGLSNTFQYKGWKLDVFLQYTKQDGFDINKYATLFGTAGASGNNIFAAQLNYWKQAGDTNVLPKPLSSASSTQTRFASSSATITDASFLRVKNVALSYQFNENVMKHLHIGGLKVFVQAQNLFTITKYDGYDPENAGLGSFLLPPLKQVTAGIQCTF